MTFYGTQCIDIFVPYNRKYAIEYWKNKISFRVGLEKTFWPGKFGSITKGKASEIIPKHGISVERRVHNFRWFVSSWTVTLDTRCRNGRTVTKVRRNNRLCILRNSRCSPTSVPRCRFFFFYGTWHVRTTTKKKKQNGTPTVISGRVFISPVRRCLYLFDTHTHLFAFCPSCRFK